MNPSSGSLYSSLTPAPSSGGTPASANLPVRAGAGAAVATGRDSLAVAERGVAAAGPVYAPINTGNITLNVGNSGADQAILQQALEALFGPALKSALAQHLVLGEATAFGDLFQILSREEPLGRYFFPGSLDAGPLPDPAVDYQAQRAGAFLAELSDLEQGKDMGWLLRGRAGLGKTRELAALAGRLQRDGWTICLARIDARHRMGPPVDALTARRVLLVIDDLQRHLGRDPAERLAYLDGLDACLEALLADLSVSVRLLASLTPGLTSAEVSEHKFWRRFGRVLDLPEFAPEELANLLQAAAARAGVALPPGDVTAMVAHCDGTPKTIVEQVRQAGREGSVLTLEHWQETWRATWVRRFLEARQRQPEVTEVYESLALLAQLGVPLRPAYVAGLATTRSQRDAWPALGLLRRMGVLMEAESLLAPPDETHLREVLQRVDRSWPTLEENWPTVLRSLIARAEGSRGATDLVSIIPQLQAAGRYQDTITVANAALTLNHDHDLAIYWRGVARLILGQSEPADADLSLYLERQPDDGQARLARGLARLQLGRYEEADADLTAAVAVDQTGARQIRAVSGLLLGRAGQAVADLSVLVEAGQANSDTLRLRALALWQNGSAQAALADLEQALTRRPDDGSARLLRVGILAQLGLGTDLEADLTELLARQPNAYFHGLRGWSRLQQGRFAEAEADLDRAIAMAAEDPFTAWVARLAHAVADPAGDESAAGTVAMTGDSSAPEPRGDGLKERLARETLALFTPFAAADDAPADDPVNERFMADWLDLSLASMRRSEPGLSLATTLPALYHFWRGAARLELDRAEAAAADFQAALDQGLVESLGLLGRGRARLALEEPAGALADLEAALAAGVANQEPNIYLWLGQARLLNDDPAGALEALTMALEKRPGSTRAHTSRARVQADLGKNEAAVDDLTAALALAPESPHLYFMRGALRHDLGQFAAAIEDLNRSLTLQGVVDGAAATAPEPGLAPVYEMRGWCHFRQGDHVAAAGDFNAALAADASLGRACYGLGAVALNLGQASLAIDSYSQAIDLGFDQPAVYLERATAHLDAGDRVNAATDLALAERAGATDGLYLRTRGLLRFHEAEHAQAVQDLSRALDLGQQDPGTHYFRGASFFHLGDFDAAATDYDRALAMGLEQPAVRAERGWIRANQGDFAGAAADLDQAIEQGAGETHIYWWRALVRYWQEEYAGAAADVSQVIAAGDAAPGYFHLRGLAHFHNREMAQAEADLSQALDLGLPDPELYLYRSLIRYDRGNYAGAAADASALIVAGQTGVLIYQIRALAAIRSGDLDQGRQDCQTAQSMAPDDVYTAECWGNLFLAEDRPEAAVATFEAFAGRSTERSIQFGLGLARLLNGDVAGSQASYEQALAGASGADRTGARQDLAFWAERLEERVIRMDLAEAIVAALTRLEAPET